MAGLLSFQPDENIAQVLAIRDYEQAPYLVLATRNGLVEKTRLGDYNSPVRPASSRSTSARTTTS